jgi:serine/threonine protein kinase
MTNKHAKEEYDELKYLNTKLNNIPNYQNYFLINNFTLCRPSKLTKNDLKNFKECGSFKKENITAHNINDSLNQLLAINMPYGGVSLEDFMINNKDYNQLKIMNQKLLELLKKGIIPMNKKHIYHNDIKASNILILTEKGDIKARLIDWSLTLEYIPFKNNTFPNNWKNRPLQFNLPFSVVLFTDLFLDMYTDFIKTRLFF